MNESASFSAMMARLARTLALALLAYSGAASAIDFAAGQVWTYHSRPEDKASTLVVGKVDDNDKLGRIIHISIRGLVIGKGPNGASLQPELPHAPISQQALEASVIAPAGQGEPAADFTEGYRLWKHAFDDGDAGIYTITVEEIVNLLEKTLVSTPDPER